MVNEKYSNGELQITLEISIQALRGIKSICNKNVHCLEEEDNDSLEIPERALRDIKDMLDGGAFQNEMWELMLKN